MKSGAMRQRVVIQQNLGVKDEAGQRVPRFVDLAEVWANVRGVGGGEVLWGVQVQASITDVLTIRYQRGISPQMRVIHDRRTLNIESVIDADGKRRELQLHCKELVDG
jgi:SPP1 family predicted phage head-tail adaptor